ncbi:MAG TPA: hypothetical protein VD886_25460 [Herpetosiphonaceae bacterium]|nr:hypothetical protein [Herpetosiphonaceae bacterium]
MLRSHAVSWGRFAAVAGPLVAIEWWIASAAAHQVVGLAITLDLLIGLPLLYYVLLVRPKTVPAGSQTGVIALAGLLAWLLLPPALRGNFKHLPALLALLELPLLGLLIWRIKRVVDHYRRLRPQLVYAGDTLIASLAEAGFPRRLAAIIATEALLLWSLLAGWFSAFRPQAPEQRAFTYHRRSGYGAVLSVLAISLIGETAGVHLLVSRWSEPAAWILSGLSAYTLLWLLGDFQAMKLNPIVLSDATLHLRTGMRWRADVPREAIRALRRCSAADRRQPGYLDLAPLGNAGWVVEVTWPVAASGVFGISKSATAFGISVDDGVALRAALEDTLAGG